jgi:SNF family Na+-dependent transporter
MLGIDSSFSAIEATSTVICDTAWGGVIPRSFVAFVLCVVGFLGSFPFCFNFGFTLFDVVDHYLCAYLLNMIGVLQAFGCGWFFDAEKHMAMSVGHRKSILFLSISYWTLIIIIGTVSSITNAVAAGFVSMTGIFCLICLPVSYKLSGLTVGKWYDEVLLTGVKRISYACS